MRRKIIFVGAMLVVSSSLFAQQNQETTIKEVTIASKTAQQINKTGKNIQLLTQKDLEKHKGQTLNEVLQQVSGIQITGNYNNTQEPKSTKIRGGKLANVLILIDGVPLKDVTANDYTAMDLRFIALENVESIEIMNGASSVLYGSNATVSVINITTKKSSKKPIEGMISARGGSFSTFAQSAQIRGNSNGFYYQLNGFNEKSEGISSAQGEDFEKDGFEKQNINANFGFKKNRFDINLNGGFNHHLYDFDEGAFADGQFRGNDQQFYAGSNAKLTYNKGQLHLNARYSENERVSQNWMNESFVDQYQYNGQNIFAELFNQYEFTNWLTFTAGLQYEDQKLGSKSVPYGSSDLETVLNIEDTELHNFDVFANAHLSYQAFNLNAGARLTDHSQFGNQWVYSINPYYYRELKSNFIKVGYSYGTAFIAPTLYQTYGSLPWVLPNFDLQPELNTSHEIDFSFGKNNHRFVVNTIAFWRNEEQAFAYQLNPDYTGNFINIDENKAKGFEIGFEATPINKFRIGGNFSFVEKDKEATMLRLPKQRINSFVEVQPLKSTRIVLSHQFVSKRQDAYYDAMSYTVKNVDADEFHLFNLNVNQKIYKGIAAFVNIGNLFNTNYVDVVGYTTKPRNFTIGFDYQF